MKVQCAWCKQFGSDKPPLKDESISHGICPACAKKFEKKNPGEERRPQPRPAFHVVDVVNDVSVGTYKTAASARRAIRARHVSTKRFIVTDEYYIPVKSNPGEAWHAGKMEEAESSERRVKKPSLKDFYHGKAIAHFESALEERARTKTRKNPLAVFTVGNPPHEIRAKVKGVIYKRCIQVKAEKTGKFQKGFWQHEFDAASEVCILALDNGDILLHSQRGIRLWEKA